MSQRVQECHQVLRFAPASDGVRGRMPVCADGTRRQGLGLHLEIDFGIAVGRLKRHVPEPRAIRVDVHAGSEEVDRSAMANHVRAGSFRGERRHLCGGPPRDA